MMRTRKLKYYILVCKVVILALPLLISTTTTKQAFSIMNFTNVDFRNKMEDKFFMNVRMLFIRRDIVATISTY